MLVLRGNQIRSVDEMRFVLSVVHLRDLWPKEANRSTRRSKSGKPMTSRGITKRGVSSKEAERRGWATVNKSHRSGRKKRTEVAGKSEANQVPAKAAEKAAGNKSLIIAETLHQQRSNV